MNSFAELLVGLQLVGVRQLDNRWLWYNIIYIPQRLVVALHIRSSVQHWSWYWSEKLLNCLLQD